MNDSLFEASMTRIIYLCLVCANSKPAKNLLCAILSLFPLDFNPPHPKVFISHYHIALAPQLNDFVFDRSINVNAGPSFNILIAL